MPQYSYAGKMRNGEAVRGRLDAASDALAAAELVASGVIPIRISEVVETTDPLETLKKQFQPKVGLEDLIIFSRQMYSLTRAGVPLIRALSGLAETARNETMATVLRDVTTHLDGGRDLATAMRAHPDVFSTLFASLVHVGESSGQLEEAFERISQYLALEQETRRRIQSAARYPVIVLVSISLALVILNIFVIPAFAGVFAGFGADLPWATKLLIETSAFFVDFWPHMMLGLGAALYGFRRFIETEGGRMWWNGKLLRFPIVGSILERAVLARFARTLSMTLSAGVPITSSLTLAGEAVDNAWVRVRVDGMRDAIERGEPLTRAAQLSGLFTPLVLQMLAIGEETGNVDELLTEVADYYEREVDHDLKKVGDMIEPILIVGIGGVVLVLALGIYLPMWELAGAAH